LSVEREFTMEERISKEIKLLAAKDIVSSYLRGEGGRSIQADQIGQLLHQVYNSVEQLVPDPEKRRVGLGVD
ncbi:MAG TPA: hypothetical protein V6C52_01210, partial [Coleofasciculaceae cyanobacterium]